MLDHPTTMQQAQILALNHNQFNGTLTSELLLYSRNQLRDEWSSLDISFNKILGPLPITFRHMLTDAHSVDSISSEGNHFRCEESGIGHHGSYDYHPLTILGAAATFL